MSRCLKITIGSRQRGLNWGRASTHFVSTYAYTHHQSVLADLKRHDTQSHGHFHHVYREAELNRVNLDRAHRILRSSGFEPAGFAAPHGRWRRSLDEQLEDLGYLYSSDFQIGYDDFPFYPWRGDGFRGCCRFRFTRFARGYSWTPGSISRN